MEGGPAQVHITKKGTTAYGLLPPRPSAGQHGTKHPVASAPGDCGPLGAGLRWCPEQWHGSVGKASCQNSKKWAAWAWHLGQPYTACDGGWSSTITYNQKRRSSIRAATTLPKRRPAWHQAPRGQRAGGSWTPRRRPAVVPGAVVRLCGKGVAPEFQENG